VRTWGGFDALISEERQRRNQYADARYSARRPPAGVRRAVDRPLADAACSVSIRSATRTMPRSPVVSPMAATPASAPRHRRRRTAICAARFTATISNPAGPRASVRARSTAAHCVAISSELPVFDQRLADSRCQCAAPRHRCEHCRCPGCARDDVTLPMLCSSPASSARRAASPVSFAIACAAGDRRLPRISPAPTEGASSAAGDLRCR